MQQKQINYKPDDETRTQAPIGNIVYEIDDDDNQNIYHSPDAVDNVEDDDVDDKVIGSDDDAQKQQLRRYDGDETGARQRHSSHTLAADKLIDGQMNHKNWGKWHVEPCVIAMQTECR